MAYVTYNPKDASHKKLLLYEIKSRFDGDNVDIYYEPSDDREQADVTPWFFAVKYA